MTREVRNIKLFARGDEVSGGLGCPSRTSECRGKGDCAETKPEQSSRTTKPVWMTVEDTLDIGRRKQTDFITGQKPFVPETPFLFILTRVP